MMVRILALSMVLYVFLNAEIVITKSDYEKIIELSPDRNIPQNKALERALETEQDYENNQKAKKEFEIKKEELKEKLIVSKKAKEGVTNYHFVITNKGVTFKDLGIDTNQLQALVSDFTTRKFTFQDLQDISNIVAYYFQVNGYPAATAYVPQQNFDGSNVQINITLGVLGKYVIKNNTSIKDYFFESKLDKEDKGKIASTSLIEDGVYKINEMNGIYTLAGLQVGENLGETDVVIEIEPSIKANVLLYGDNYGIKSSGEYRTGVSMGFNSLFNMGDYYNFYLQSSNERQVNFGASYSFFIDNVKVTPNVSQGTYSLGGEYKDDDFYGKSRNMGIDFSLPIWINTKSSFYLTSGLYYKILSDTKLGILTTDKHSTILNFGFNGLYRGIENNTLSYSAIMTTGKIKDDGTKISGVVSKTGGNGFGWFDKANISLNNYYFINEYITHIVNINLQKVIGKFELDSSENSSLGGVYGVRAYNNGDGDNTIVANFGIGIHIPNTNFYFTPFYDIGYAWYEKGVERYLNNHFLDAVDLQIFYSKPDKYYIKLDGARTVYKYKLDDYRMKFYLNGGIYF